MRNDTHRPSVINPSEYQFVAFEHVKIEGVGDCLEMLANRERIKAHMARTGGTYSRHEHGGNCHICGASAIYTVLFYHSLTNSYIRTGGDCAEKLDFAFGDFDAFKQAARHEAHIAKGKRAGAAAWTAAGLGRALELIAERNALPVIEGLDAYEGNDAAWAEMRERNRRWSKVDKLAEMLGTTERHGVLSEKMIGYAQTLIRQHEQFAVVAAERAAEKEAAAPCPSGRVTITGTIIKVEERESDWGLTTKMLVKAAEGFMVWSTLPAGAPAERGAEITFKATVTPAKDDPKFGFASRPHFARA